MGYEEGDAEYHTPRQVENEGIKSQTKVIDIVEKAENWTGNGQGVLPE